MRLTKALTALLFLVGAPAEAMIIHAPDMAEHGGVIPVEIRPGKPLSAGQRLVLMVNGETAAQFRVVKGTLTAIVTRIKGTRNITTVVARVVAGGSEMDSGSRNIRVNLTVPDGGPATAPGGVMMRNRGGGDVLMRLSSANGFSGTLLLQGNGLLVEITGSLLLTANPIIGVRGDFSGQVTASINGQTRQATANPREDNPAAAQAREEAREQQRRQHQVEMERLKADQAARETAAEQERKEARRRDRQEALGVLRTYANTSASMGNNKSANRLSRLEALTRKPTEGENRVSTALNNYADRVDRKYPNAAPPASGSYPPPTGSPSPTGATSTTSAAQLSPQQIVACDTDIHNMQRESQRWGGNVNDVANRLGRYQKELFEGRCAGHPQAAAYIRGANKLLGYRQETSAASGNNNQSNGLKPIRRDTQSTEHNPIHNASSCIKIYGPAEMKARGMHGVLPSTMVNTCPYSVSVQWCVASENGRSGDCRPGYSNLVNLSGAGQKGSNRYGVSAVNQTVHFAACRYGKNMGFQRVEMDPRHPFRFSCS